MKKKRDIGILAFLLCGVVLMNSCFSTSVFASTVSGNDAAVIQSESVAGETAAAETDTVKTEETVSAGTENIVEEGGQQTVSGNDIQTEKTVELTQEFEGTLVTMSGPASSFPKAESLSISVAQIDEQTVEVVEKAIAEEAEKQGKEVVSYQAFDIKLLADGEEVQPLGPVYVTFAKDVVANLLDVESTDVLKNVSQAIATAEVKAMEAQISKMPVSLAETDTTENADIAEGAETTEEIKVFHVNEDTGVAQDMEAEVTAEGEVVMETDHFSVYVAVNLGPTSTGEVKLIVKHYANITYIPENLTADASVVYQKATTSNESMSAVDEIYDKAKGIVKTETKLRKIYSDDSINLPNGYSGLLKDLSKVYLADKSNKNYTIEGYYLLKSGGDANNVNDYLRIADNDTLEFVNAGETKTILIKYIPVTTGTLEQDVLFFDYNYTNGYIYDADSTDASKKKVSQSNMGTQDSHKYINAKMKGINSLIHSHSENDGTKTVYTIGNWANGVVTGTDENIYYKGSSSNYAKVAATGKLTKYLDGVEYQVWNTINRISQGPQITTSAGTKIYPYLTVAEGIIKKLEGTNYQTVVAGDNIFLLPDLFSSNPIEENGKYYKNVYNDCKLVFSQNGETYTLSSVKDGSGNTIDTAKNLETITNYKDSSYTNNFWPLDNVAYYNGKDPLMGQYLATGKSGNNSNVRPYSNFGAIGQNNEDPLNANDDYTLTGEKTAHNWLFGMRYDFTFTIGDYEGPMNFYFRGDDDFWLFIDGILAIDIGGIHIAQGESLNIRDWIQTTYANDSVKSDPDYPHQISIIYTERGGFGSCCYMQFTLPNVTPLNIDTTVEYTSFTANKEWDDTINGFTNGIAYINRPGSVEVQLQRKENGTWVDLEGMTATLSPVNKWTYTWSNLLKKNPQTGALYEYGVREVNAREDYAVKVNGGTITNTLKRISISTQKSWSDTVWDGNAYAGRPASIPVVLYQNGNEYRTAVLDAGNNWSYTWDKLPEYDSSGNKYSYTVDESSVPEEYTKVVSGTSITNTLVKTSVTVEKKWENETGVSDSRPDSIWVRLEQKTGDSWVRVTNGSTKLPDVELTSAKAWKHTFTELPKYDASGAEIQYRVREVTENNGTVIEAGSLTDGKDGWTYKVSYGSNNKTIINTLQKTSLTLTKRIDKTDVENATAIFRYLVTGPNDYSAKVTVSFETGTVKVDGTVKVTDTDLADNIGFDKSGLSVTIDNLQPGTYTVIEYAARGYELVKQSTTDGTPADDATAINGVQTPLSVNAAVERPGTAYYWNRCNVPTDYTAVNRFSVDSDGKLNISVVKKNS